MASLFKTTFFVSSIVVLSLIVFPLFSHSTWGAFGKIAPPANSGLKSYTATGAVNKVIQAVLGLVGVVAVAALVFGGFRYLTALGDEDAASKGKKTVLYAVIGLVIIGLSVIIVNFVVNAI